LQRRGAFAPIVSRCRFTVVYSPPLGIQRPNGLTVSSRRQSCGFSGSITRSMRVQFRSSVLTKVIFCADRAPVKSHRARTQCTSALSHYCEMCKRRPNVRLQQADTSSAALRPMLCLGPQSRWRTYRRSVCFGSSCFAGPTLHGDIGRLRNSRVPMTAHLSNAPQFERTAPRHVAKIAICCQQHEIVANTKLCQQRVDCPNLHAGTPAVIAQLGSCHMIFAIGL